jgi:alanyl-tRNA synthetase
MDNMEQQRQRAREALKDKESNAWGSDSIDGLDSAVDTEFVGYDNYEIQGEITHIIKDGRIVESACEGETAVFILDRTPFYAESGGQAADTGYLETEGIRVRVTDCKKNANGVCMHTGFVEKGITGTGINIKAYIDIEQRLATARNHTTTHLLQKALKNVLGEHVNQAGSMVSQNRLRFDFTHFAPLTKEEIKRIENDVNSRILENLPVYVEEMDINDARQRGATALFGEKYGQVVRVVSIGEYSRELCGGTHLQMTAQAGIFKITSESGIASGVRRIEALTGEAALRHFSENEDMLEKIAGALKTNPLDSLKRIESMYAELKELQKQVELLRNEIVQKSSGDILQQKREINGIGVLSVRIDRLDAEALRDTAEKLRSKIGSGVVVVGSANEEKVNFVAMATEDAVKRGIHSGNLIKEAARITGGGGGGRPDMAQAGGKDASRLDEALEAVYTEVQKQLVSS